MIVIVFLVGHPLLIIRKFILREKCSCVKIPGSFLYTLSILFRYIYSITLDVPRRAGERAEKKIDDVMRGL